MIIIILDDIPILIMKATPSEAKTNAKAIKLKKT